MSTPRLGFEKDIAELEEQIGRLRTLARQRGLEATSELRDLEEKLPHNFGMPHPEGYRKALRLMRMAEKFGAPTITLIDTPGAYPGIGAEERGQGEAIAMNLREMARLQVPILAVVV